MKKYFYAFFPLLLAFSCSDSDELFSDIESCTNTSLIDVSPKAADGEYRTLGFGYDITGEYLDKNSIK